MIVRVFIPIVYLLSTIIPFNLTEWQAYAEDCSTVIENTLIMECVSTGLLYKTPLDTSKRIEVSVEVKVRAAIKSSTNRYWVGLALNSNVISDTNYVEAAITNNIVPYEYNTPVAALLADSGNPCCISTENISNVWDTWHILKIIYENNTARVIIDEHIFITAIQLQNPTTLELLCVGTNPGEAGNTSIAECHFRNLSIQIEE